MQPQQDLQPLSQACAGDGRKQRMSARQLPVIGTPDPPSMKQGATAKEIIIVQKAIVTATPCLNKRHGAGQALSSAVPLRRPREDVLLGQLCLWVSITAWL